MKLSVEGNFAQRRRARSFRTIEDAPLGPLPILSGSEKLFETVDFADLAFFYQSLAERWRLNKLILKSSIRIGIQHRLRLLWNDKQPSRRRERKTVRDRSNPGWLLERIVRSLVLNAFGYSHVLRPRVRGYLVDNWARQRSLTELGFVETLKQAFQNETDELVLHLGPLWLRTGSHISPPAPDAAQREESVGMIPLRIVIGMGVLPQNSGALPSIASASARRPAFATVSGSNAMQMRIITQRSVKVPCLTWSVSQPGSLSTPSTLRENESTILRFDLKSELLALLGATTMREYPLLLINIDSSESFLEADMSPSERMLPRVQLEAPLPSVWRKTLPLGDPRTGLWSSNRAFVFELEHVVSSADIALRYPGRTPPVLLAIRIEWRSERLVRISNASKKSSIRNQKGSESSLGSTLSGASTVGNSSDGADSKHGLQPLFCRSCGDSPLPQMSSQRGTSLSKHPNRGPLLRYCLWRSCQRSETTASLATKGHPSKTMLPLSGNALTCLWCSIRFSHVLALLLHLEATHDLAMYWPSLDEIIIAMAIDEKHHHRAKLTAAKSLRHWLTGPNTRKKHSYIIHMTQWPPQASLQRNQTSGHVKGREALPRHSLSMGDMDPISGNRSPFASLPNWLNMAPKHPYEAHQMNGQMTQDIAQHSVITSEPPRRHASSMCLTLPRFEVFVSSLPRQLSHLRRLHPRPMVSNNEEPLHDLIWDWSAATRAPGRNRNSTFLHALYAFWSERKIRLIRQRGWLFLRDQVSMVSDALTSRKRTPSGSPALSPSPDLIGNSIVPAAKLPTNTSKTIAISPASSSVAENDTNSAKAVFPVKRVDVTAPAENMPSSEVKSLMKKHRKKRRRALVTLDIIENAFEVSPRSQSYFLRNRSGSVSVSSAVRRCCDRPAATANHDRGEMLESVTYPKQRGARRLATIAVQEPIGSMETKPRRRVRHGMRMPSKQESMRPPTRATSTAEQTPLLSVSKRQKLSPDVVPEVNGMEKTPSRQSRLFDRTYYHSFTFAPMSREEVLASHDSEVEDVDESWLGRLSDQRIDQFIDVLPVEKTLMKAWNAFVREVNPILADRSIREAVQRFASWFVSRQWADATDSIHHQYDALRAVFFMHLRALWQFHLIGLDHITKAMDAFHHAWNDHEVSFRSSGSSDTIQTRIGLSPNGS